jgi:hypothetical protein
VTLTSLDGLRISARDELLTQALNQVQRRAAQMREFAFSLWQTERHSPTYFTIKLRPDIDAASAKEVAGAASVLGSGVEKAMLGIFPAPLRFLEDGNTLVGANDLEEFVRVALEILDEMDVRVAELKQQMCASPK